MQIPALSGIRVLWLQWTNSHRLGYRVLWRKRDCLATLSRGECLDPCLDRLLLLFWAHYIEDDTLTMHSFALGGYRKQRRGCC